MRTRSKKDLEQENQMEDAAIATAIAGSSSAGSTEELSSLDNDLKRAQLAFMQNTLAARQKKIDDEVRRTEIRVESAKAAQLKANHEKAVCGHRRQDMSFSVNGQYLSDGRACALCQRCQQAWFDVPRKGSGELVIPPEIRAYLEAHGESFGNAMGGNIPVAPAAPLPVSAVA